MAHVVPVLLRVLSERFPDDWFQPDSAAYSEPVRLLADLGGPSAPPLHHPFHPRELPGHPGAQQVGQPQGVLVYRQRPLDPLCLGEAANYPNYRELRRRRHSGECPRRVCIGVLRQQL